MGSDAYSDKRSARQAVWDRLAANKAARFPLPPHGRIPNFAGADQAAERLAAHPSFRSARRIKANPDSAQRAVRKRALDAGITVCMPTPRLRGGFKKLDPTRIPPEKTGEAATLSRAEEWAEEVPVDRLPEVDLVVSGSVAVTRDGCRCGKGEGYGDLEFAILRELGHPPVPVVTTVHPLQLVDAFPPDPTDLPVHRVVTPEETVEVPDPPPAPAGVDWSRLTERDLDAMPVLRDVQAHARRTG